MLVARNKAHSRPLDDSDSGMQPSQMDANDTSYCYCGSRAKIWTSWTDNNPGRSFLGCSKYKSNGCGYFGWFDPPMCLRRRQIIPKLLRRIEQNRRKEKMYWVCIILSWLITIVIVGVVMFGGKAKKLNGEMLFLA
ncbi:hypothetical protein L1049_023415 [Liquidambar formosana]|uniref:GRF-type domain-containing protein n=1 Tax=Liquidambar formosana TaxID=63359 RepID=A0AAP0X0J6_LIQFO